VTAGADQADGLRRLLNARACRIVAIAGFSSGVGTTTTAMNLGVELARDGTPVLLLDEHGRAPRSACAAWSIAPRGTLEDVACGRMKLSQAAAAAACGVLVLPVPVGCTEASFNPRALSPRGVIVIDAALDETGRLSPLARVADELVIVMQPLPASITATYAGLKRLQYTHALQQFDFVVNGVASPAQGRLVIANITNAGSRYLAVSLRPLGWIGSHALVGEARSRSRTVCEAHPDSAPALDFRRLAAALASAAPAAPSTGAPGPSGAAPGMLPGRLGSSCPASAV
jgi:flagellar biosynthesis protein FlhG